MLQNSKNLRPLDILACDSANKTSFLNPSKSLFGALGKKPFVRFGKYGLYAELQARMSRRRKCLLFLKHKCLVTLTWIHEVIELDVSVPLLSLPYLFSGMITSSCLQ